MEIRIRDFFIFTSIIKLYPYQYLLGLKYMHLGPWFLSHMPMVLLMVISDVPFIKYLSYLGLVQTLNMHYFHLLFSATSG